MTNQIAADVQKLEPGPRWRGFELDASMYDMGVFRFHGHGGPNIMWQGHEYHSWDIRASGFALTNGQQPRPSLQIANIQYSISEILELAEDLRGCKLTVHETFTKYLDNGETPDPNEHFPEQIWYVESKKIEADTFIELELVSGLDIAGTMLPGRQILADYCTFEYRSEECGYTGPPVATIDDTPTTDPALDRCSKCLKACRLRFGQNEPLRFGGFPGASLMRV